MEEVEKTLNEIWVKDFTQEAAMKFREKVLIAASGDPNKPITIFINSYGGHVDALAKMLETLDEIPNPIVTVCAGCAMSCGAVLLSHGDVRFLGKHSRVMIHEVSSGTFGNVQDMKDDVKETVRLNEYFMGLLARNCGFKDYAEFRSVIKQQDGRERYLVGQEAVKFGIVDTIGLPKISSKVQFEVNKQPTKVPFATRQKQSITKGKKRLSKKKSAAKKPKPKTKKR